jgi:hypothetical protein
VQNVAVERDSGERLGFDNWAEHEAFYLSGKPIEETSLFAPSRSGRCRGRPATVCAAVDPRAVVGA